MEIKPSHVKIFAIVIGVLCIGGYFAYDLYRLHSFPDGYRNKPSTGIVRPGQQEFSDADDNLSPLLEITSREFGNNAIANRIAKKYSEELGAIIQEAFSGGSKINLFEKSAGPIMTYCRLSENECAFLVYIPELRRFESSDFSNNDSITVLANLAWELAQAILKSEGIKDMELGIGLRGISQYGPIMLGFFKNQFEENDNGMIKYIKDGRTKTHFLWSFFASRKDN